MPTDFQVVQRNGVVESPILRGASFLDVPFAPLAAARVAHSWPTDRAVARHPEELEGRPESMQQRYGIPANEAVAKVGGLASLSVRPEPVEGRQQGHASDLALRQAQGERSFTTPALAGMTYTRVRGLPGPATPSGSGFAPTLPSLSVPAVGTFGALETTE